MRRKPPDILITTPESLYLMMTSQVREILTGVEAVIVDEIHAVAQSKRGSHLVLTLERLSHLVTGEGGDDPQRIGLSATQRPLERIANFLVGPKRECEIVNAGIRKDLDLEIVVPVDDMTEPGAVESSSPPATVRSCPTCRPTGSTRPDRVVARPGGQPPLDLARDLSGAAQARPRAHLDDHLRQQPPRRRTPRQAPERAPQRATPRGAAGDRARRNTPARPRLDAGRAGRDGECRIEEIARAHHGSLAHEERVVVEELLKSGKLPCLVATSLARARHRHGRPRPRDPGRVAEVGLAGPAAGRPRRPPAQRGLEGAHLPEVPRRPARVRGGRQAHARAARSRRR